MLHALRQVFGPIHSVVGRMETQLKTWDLGAGETMPVETDDTSHALLRFASGAMGTFITSWTAADSPGFVIDAMGSKGRLRLESHAYPNISSAKLYAAKAAFSASPTGAEIAVPDRLFMVGGRPVAAAEPASGSGGQRPSLGRLFEGFAHAVRHGGEPPVSFARALEVQGVIEALYESDARRAWVDIPPPA
jgi:predicted dehydrogenase